MMTILYNYIMHYFSKIIVFLDRVLVFFLKFLICLHWERLVIHKLVNGLDYCV